MYNNTSDLMCFKIKQFFYLLCKNNALAYHNAGAVVGNMGVFKIPGSRVYVGVALFVEKLN
jgi:hypothetical protein